MKKLVTLLMVLAMVFSSLGAGVPVAAAVDAGGQTPSLTDIQGTKYEAAVQSLIGLEVLSGYTDGTFRPESTITRAEMAKVIVKSLNKSNYADLKTLPFTDIAGNWASDYISIAYSIGAINGTTTTTFAPSNGVTYVQAAAMLLRALGHTDASLGGTWPSNYMNKAAELGLFDAIDEQGKAELPAIRGDIALMTDAVVQEIRLAWQEPEEEPQDNGKLAEYNGRAIGLPLSVNAEINANGDAVDELEFLMGEETYYLNTDDLGDVTSADFMVGGKYTGNLYAARMRNGVVLDVEIASALNLNRYVELTANGGVGAFRKITQNQNERIAIIGAALADFAYADGASCYEAVFDGNDFDTFKSISTSEIDANDYIRAWDLDADYAGVAIVMVVIDQDDVAAATPYFGLI